jgi:hypothetical protein
MADNRSHAGPGLDLPSVPHGAPADACLASSFADLRVLRVFAVKRGASIAAYGPWAGSGARLSCRAASSSTGVDGTFGSCGAIDPAMAEPVEPASVARGMLHMLLYVFATPSAKVLLLTGAAIALLLPIAPRRPSALAVAACVHLMLMTLAGLDTLRMGWVAQSSPDPALKANLLSQSYSDFMHGGQAGALALIPALVMGVLAALATLRGSTWRPGPSLTSFSFAACATLAFASSTIAPAPGVESWAARVVLYGALSVVALFAPPPAAADTKLAWAIAIALGAAAVEIFALTFHQVISHGCVAHFSPELRYQQLDVDVVNATDLWHASALTIAVASTPALREVCRRQRRPAAVALLLSLGLITVTRHPGPVFGFLLADWRSAE